MGLTVRDEIMRHWSEFCRQPVTVTAAWRMLGKDCSRNAVAYTLKLLAKQGIMVEVAAYSGYREKPVKAYLWDAQK